MIWRRPCPDGFHMSSGPGSLLPGAAPTIAAVEYLRRYVAALAVHLPALQHSHTADRQMVVHMLDEQIAYLHRCRRQMCPASPEDQQPIEEWCVLCFHLQALQRQLSEQTPPAATLRHDPAYSCDLPYDPALAHSRPPDIYITLEPSA
jgi:hypothetical protein